MTQPKVSFQNKTVSHEPMVMSFDQMGALEEMLNDQVILFTCDKVDPVAAQKVAELGALFGLDIDPNPEDAEPVALTAVETPELEEQYQVNE